LRDGPPPTPTRTARRSNATATTSIRLLVRRSKADAGTCRRPPIADNLRTVLSNARELAGRPRTGEVIDRSVTFGKSRLGPERAWEKAGMSRIALQELRPHIRVVADGGWLHDQGADGVHGPRRPADGQPLREPPPAARAKTMRPTDATRTWAFRSRV
jgi:hypothetical protein